ncbi:hypothetical protein I551_7653 [Mycobacterium ulcerans str. Harvey]|uniref:Uncharacterized protein n=1 Tax=Mycobacterium ulcerans str. Harvey TaxID=1299332 RepID=A0ABN0QN11_MYCUL|nr:hypothetical protein I551_7653 [Mycobacterium ulcerans str. Harvey]
MGVVGLLDLTLLAQRVVGHHHQEIDHPGDQDEVDGGRQQYVQVDALAAADADLQDAQIGLLVDAHPVDQRRDDAVGEPGDQRRECRTDDHGDGQVDDIAPREKLLEPFEHWDVLSGMDRDWTAFAVDHLSNGGELLSAGSG